MFIGRLFILVFGLLSQGAAPTTDLSSHLTSFERGMLERESSIESRIRLYESISGRLHRSVTPRLGDGETVNLSAELESWLKVLLTAQRDIEANIGRKKKSKNLIRFEIHLRKVLTDVREHKVDASADSQEYLESWLSRTEEVRRRMVDILFDR